MSLENRRYEDRKKLIMEKIKSIKNKDTQLLAEICYLSTEQTERKIEELGRNITGAISSIGGR